MTYDNRGYNRSQALNICPCNCYRCKNMRGYACLANKVFKKCWHDETGCPSYRNKTNEEKGK